MEYVSEIALKADGFDDAIIGVSTNGLIVYDYDKCMNILISNNNWKYLDALQFMEHNVIGSFMGEGTPIFIHTNG